MLPRASRFLCSLTHHACSKPWRVLWFWWRGLLFYSSRIWTMTASLYSRAKLYFVYTLQQAVIMLWQFNIQHLQPTLMHSERHIWEGLKLQSSNLSTISYHVMLQNVLKFKNVLRKVWCRQLYICLLMILQICVFCFEGLLKFVFCVVNEIKCVADKVWEIRFDCHEAEYCACCDCSEAEDRGRVLNLEKKSE